MEHNTVWWQVVGQAAPHSAVTRLIEYRIHDFTARVLCGPSAGFWLGHQRANGNPLLVRQVGRVRHPCHGDKGNLTRPTRLPRLFGHALSEEAWADPQTGFTAVRK